MLKKLFLKKVQTTHFYPNGWVKPGTFYKNEKRRIMSSKYEFIYRKGYKNNIPMWFNLNKR